jgi:CubicO group peptidase (beta-lactamase class C family)
MCRSGRHLLLFCACLLLLSGGCAGDAVESRITSVESGLLAELGDPPWRRLALADRMAHYNVPGVGIAVVNDFEIEWAKGYGVLEAGGDEPVTPDTLFQAASIGKTIVAVTAMRLVEGGLLDLDRDVNERLTSWKVPASEFTAHEKVTLRRLLSHSAGTNSYGYQGYARGRALPTLRQVLDGEPPANSPPARVVAVPGTGFDYSNSGFVIVQQLLMDVTGKPFERLAAEKVLDPVGMTHTTFEVPLPARLESIVARGHWPDGRAIEGGWHTYPEQATGASLWATPSDLARFGIEMMRAYNGEAGRAVPADVAREVLTRQTPDGARYGLGFGVSEESGRGFYFSHDGGTEGYRCFFVMYPGLGRGAVIMTNGHAGDGLWREILNGISVEYELVPDFTVEAASAILLLLAVGVALFIRWRRRRRAGLQPV